MKRILSGLALGVALGGCGDVANEGPETTTIQEVIKGMVEKCEKSPSDVDAVVCPIATESGGLEGYVRLGCWTSRGELDCVQTTVRVCEKNVSSVCRDGFDKNSTVCSYDDSYEVIKPDLSTDAFYERVRSEYRCSSQ